MRPFLSICIFSIVTLAFISCSSNPYALTDDEIISRYKEFAARINPEFESRLKMLPKIADEAEANMAIALKDWSLTELQLRDDWRGPAENVNGEYYPTLHSNYNFISMPISSLRGEYPKHSSSALLNEFSVYQFQQLRDEGYKISTGPPYTKEGHTIQLIRDTISTSSLVNADYLGVLIPVSKESGHKLDEYTFESGAYSGVAMLYDFSAGKFIGGFIFSAVNSNEIEYNSTWGSSDETVEFVLSEDLRKQVRSAYLNGFKQRCDYNN